MNAYVCFHIMTEHWRKTRFMIRKCVHLFVCTGFVCAMCNRQAGLLLTAMAAPWGICRRKTLLRLAMEWWDEKIIRGKGMLEALSEYFNPPVCLTCLLIHSCSPSHLTPSLLRCPDVPSSTFFTIIKNAAACYWMKKQNLSTGSTSYLTKECWDDNVQVGFLCVLWHCAT